MRDAHGGVGGVHALAAGAARTVHVDTQVVFVDLHVNLVGLGQHGNGGGGGMNAPLAFGLGHALHTVHARFELHDRIHVIALDLELNLFIAAGLGRRNVHGLHLPSVGLAETHVHLVQIAREDGRLVAAGGGTNLNDDVLLVGGIRGDEHELDIFLELRELRLGRRNGLLGEFLHVGIGKHLFGVIDVVARLDILAATSGPWLAYSLDRRAYSFWSASTAGSPSFPWSSA